MAEILGLLKISHGQAIGGLTLEADLGHGPGEGLAVGVAGAAAVDREASQRVAPGPGRGAKVGLGLDQKAGNLGQRANPNPSLTGALAHVLEADLRMSMRNPEAGLALDLGPPKKMEKVTLSQNPDQGANLVPIHPPLLHPQRLVLCPPHQKELLQGPVLDLARGQGPGPVPEINSELSVLCTLLQNSFLLA